MGAFSLFHWLIVFVILLLFFAVPVAIVVIVLVLGRSGKLSGNLVPCPDCNRLLSPLARTCPHCGRPLSPSSPSPPAPG